MDYGEPLWLVLDTETTGIDPAKDRIVEIGYCVTTPTRWVAAGNVLVNPGMPIPPEASAVHHITDEDVAGRPTLDEAWPHVLTIWSSIGPFMAIAAHNKPFDRGFLAQKIEPKCATCLQPATCVGRYHPETTDSFACSDCCDHGNEDGRCRKIDNEHLLSADLPWVDTLRMARRWWPDLPHHTNQFLRYQWRVELDPKGSANGDTESRHLLPHRAMADAIVTAANLRHMLRGAPGEKLEELGPAGLSAYIDEPMLLQTVGFGKHKGSPWAAVPWDYLGWLSRQPDLDIDVAHTVRHYLRGRNR